MSAHADATRAERERIVAALRKRSRQFAFLSRGHFRDIGDERRERECAGAALAFDDMATLIESGGEL